MIASIVGNYLKDVGYKVTNSTQRNTCPKIDDISAINAKDKYYDYCVYRFDTVKGPYYHVTVFISFDIPIISSFLRIPVSGETKIIYEL